MEQFVEPLDKIYKKCIIFLVSYLLHFMSRIVCNSENMKLRLGGRKKNTLILQSKNNILYGQKLI